MPAAAASLTTPSHGRLTITVNGNAPPRPSLRAPAMTSPDYSCCEEANQPASLDRVLSVDCVARDPECCHAGNPEVEPPTLVPDAGWHGPSTKRKRLFCRLLRDVARMEVVYTRRECSVVH
jgi:hypothetical protein